MDSNFMSYHKICNCRWEVDRLIILDVLYPFHIASNGYSLTQNKYKSFLTSNCSFISLC